MAPTESAASPDRPLYRVKRLLLGPPLITEQLRTERLSNPLALGVLASDCISSTAYGSEEILRILIPVIGIASFSMLMPLTGVIVFVLLLLTLSYRDVVTVYTRAGGSYIVARENFGPNVAQVAAVALLIDYIVTVAVQTAAGTDALISLAHLVGNQFTGLDHLKEPVSVAVVLVLMYGNLRGLREAGRAFAAPAYLFVVAVALMMLVGVGRFAVQGHLPKADVHAAGALSLGHPHGGLLYGASLFIVLRAFANGGSSLTGLEAISNGVSVFRHPQGANARRTLVAMSCILGVLVLGVSALAHFTHALPYTDGNPTVIAQEAHLLFGGGVLGTVLLVFVQLATALILYTGANTSFTGFPFLASFVAEDSFLPRQLTRRGHRLAFSNGIVVLTVLALALLLVTGGNLDRLVALYAIGVFTGFIMAAAGLTAYHCPAAGAGPHLEAGGQRRGRHRLGAGGGDLRGHQVHRGRLAGGGPLPARRVGADPGQPAVPRGGRRDGGAARPRRRHPAVAPPPGLRARRQPGPGHHQGTAVRAPAAARTRSAPCTSWSTRRTPGA